MMRRLFLFVFLFCFFSGFIKSQPVIAETKTWWVFFTDKNGTTFDPYTWFSPEAITRRNNNHISLYDPTDFPVNEYYLAQVAKRVDTLGQVTRWFNGVGVVATDKQVNEVRKLPFVREVTRQRMMSWAPAMNPDTVLEDFNNHERIVAQQIEPLEGNEFEKRDKKGSGIIIAILDAGFKGTNTHPAFAHIRFNNQIRATRDFVKNRDDVYTGADHGTMVLSCIGGIVNGTQMGLAPEATFLLARIAKEYGNEYRGEENFLAAIEWADKLGAMIINCSGGPGEGAYFPEQMDGKIPLISRASNLAARKGILVIAAAGNQGQNQRITNLLPPSDADSVLCVTAVNDSGYVASYSSVGPTPDFRRKPDVCAPGTAILADGYGDYSVGEGTSFSAPLLAGFAACLMQLFPDIQAMQLADTIRHCASLYPYFDYAHGYGIPKASYFFNPRKEIPVTFTIRRDGNSVSIVIADDHKPESCSSPAFLYYNIETASGKISKYEVVAIYDLSPVIIDEGDLRVGMRINAFYKGHYARLEL
jgi:serine protease AprX